MAATGGKLSRMDATGETMDAMTWWDYVKRHSAGAVNSHIAEAVGITPSSVGRWGKGSKPDPAQAAAFARAYGRPVLEAFVAAGFLTAAEAGEKPSAPPSLASLSGDELLDEVRRRMQGGQHEDPANPAQKSVKLTTRSDVMKAARRGNVPDKQD